MYLEIASRALLSAPAIRGARSSDCAKLTKNQIHSLWPNDGGWVPLSKPEYIQTTKYQLDPTQSSKGQENGEAITSAVLSNRRPPHMFPFLA